MKSITIHKMDEDTVKALDELSSKERLSLNQLIKGLLKKSLGLNSNEENHRDDFAEFCGNWTEKEAQEFSKATQCFEEIDEEVWK